MQANYFWKNLWEGENLKLYYIKDQIELRGKEIKDICVTGYRDFGNFQVITTTDGGIFACKLYQKSVYEDPDDIEISIMPLKCIELERELANEYSLLRTYLRTMGVLDKEIKEFAKDEIDKREKKRQADMAERKKKKYEESKKFIEEYEKSSV